MLKCYLHYNDGNICGVYLEGHAQPQSTLTLHPQAGAVAAFTIDLLVYPLDTLKTRYQSQDYIKTGAKGHANNPFALRGLYQGIGSVVLATVPAGESIYLFSHPC
jgi:hypothetical protein